MQPIYISHAVNRLSRIWLKQLGNLLIKNGHTLTPQQYYTLHAIRQYGPIGTVELAELLSAERTTVSRGLVMLTKDKMTSIEPSDDDRRVSLVSILDAGLKVLEATEPLVEKFEKKNCEIWYEACKDASITNGYILTQSIESVLKLIAKKEKKNV